MPLLASFCMFSSLIGSERGWLLLCGWGDKVCGGGVWLGRFWCVVGVGVWLGVCVVRGGVW